MENSELEVIHEKEEHTDIITFNVGGYLYTTTVGTLVKHPHSVLASFFCGTEDASDLMTDPEGNFFIDRDGQLFRLVLNFMRSNELCISEAFEDFEQLRQEAEFYNLPGLIEAVEALRERRILRKLESSKIERCQEVPKETIIMRYIQDSNDIEVSGKVDIVQQVFEGLIDFAEVNDVTEANGLAYYTKCRLTLRKKDPTRPYKYNVLRTQASVFDLMFECGFALAANTASGDAHYRVEKWIFTRTV